MADIDRDIKQGTAGAADQLTLHMWFALKMQAAHCTRLHAHGLIVLNEGQATALGSKKIGTKGLCKISPLITDMTRNQQLYTR
ncbi:hypothetical protein M527_01175 [Sphingobium indicum IP26]|nr:hypothetical protein M527_01175 [Sphingobium indicum IP26]